VKCPVIQGVSRPVPTEIESELLNVYAASNFDGAVDFDARDNLAVKMFIKLRVG